jgi:hypothetical protein
MVNQMSKRFYSDSELKHMRFNRRELQHELRAWAQGKYSPMHRSWLSPQKRKLLVAEIRTAKKLEHDLARAMKLKLPDAVACIAMLVIRVRCSNMEWFEQGMMMLPDAKRGRTVFNAASIGGRNRWGPLEDRIARCQEMIDDVDRQMRMGLSITSARRNTARKFRVSDKTVLRAPKHLCAMIEQKVEK